MANKQRMISAAKLVTVLAKKFRNRMIHYDDLMATIADIPTTDAVEVVRCKNCKHYYDHPKSDRRCCYVHITTPHFMPEQGFCSYGERRTDG